MHDLYSLKVTTDMQITRNDKATIMLNFSRDTVVNSIVRLICMYNLCENYSRK